MPTTVNPRRADLRRERVPAGPAALATCLYRHTGYPQWHAICHLDPARMRSLLTRLQSDEALMLAYQGGDVMAFEALYRRHKDALYAFIHRSCPRPDVVEELVQDSWMAVIDSAARYQPRARFKTWLYQIAHNRQVDYWRRRDNHHGALDTASEAIAGPAADTEHVLAAIGELPRDQKDALLLQEQGFSLADIAAITGAGEETVKSRLRYARKQLRACLEGES